MDPLQAQRHNSPSGMSYSFPGQQDDFSTPFNDNPSFSDPNALFNQNYSQTFATEFQNSNDNVTDQGFQQSLGDPGQYGAFMQPPPDSAGWSSGASYIDQNPYSYSNLGQQNFSNNGFGQQRMPGYGQDMNMNFSFPTRPFNTPQAAQRSATISPAVIEQSEQDAPASSAMQNQTGMWQTRVEVPEVSSMRVTQSAPTPNKRLTPSPQPSTPSQIQVIVPPVAAPKIPSKASLDHNALQAGVPKGSTEGKFHIRKVDEYGGRAASVAVKGWIFLSKENFEINESRLASLPEAPVRSSISQLRVKLSNSEAASLHPGAKAKLEEKLNKREKKDKSKKKKEKSLLPKAPKTSTKAASASAQRVNADDTVESDSEAPTDSNDSDSGSDYDMDSEHEDEPSPLPSTKPKDPVEARKYEIVEAVWAPSSRRLSADALKARFGPWLENLQKARKEWKTATTVAERNEKKKQLEELIRLTTRHGHSNFIESIDQLPPLATLVAASATELIKAERYEDPLMEAIMHMFLKISVIKWSFLVQTRLNKLIPRVVKNAKDKMKAAAELLMEKINRSEKESSTSEKKTGQGATGAVKIEDTSDIGTLPAATKDRPASDIKKAVVSSSDTKPSLSSLVGAKKVIGNSSDVKKTLTIAGQKRPSPTTTTGRMTLGALSKPQTMARTNSADAAAAKGITTAAAAKDKERTRHVATKPPSIFSSITASKRPGVTSTTPKAPLKDVKPIPKPTPKVEAKPAPPRAPSAPIFSFAETLASIGKPKEEQKPKKDTVDNRPPESEEEKKKRLRKESRRHLRVTWPADDQLCHIKLFDHGLEDEIAHEGAEVADLKDEGRAFKREYRQQHNKTIDFEQDFIKDSDDVLDPEATDFSEIEEAQTKTNIESRAGGHKPIESPEAADQQKREQSVMIAIYTTLQDLPHTPREPPADSWTTGTQQCDFGSPPDWIKNRSAAEMERLQRNPKPQQNSSVTDLLKNLSQFSQPQLPPQQPMQSQQPPFSGTAAANVQSLLAQLANPQQSQQSTPPPIPAQSNAYDPQAAINLFMSMQNNQHQAPAAPAPAPPQPVQPALGGSDLSSILSNLAALNGQGQSQAAQPPVVPQQQPPQQNNGVDPDILAFLNQYNSTGSQSTAQQPAQNQGQPGLDLLSLLGSQQAGQQNAAQAFAGQWGQNQADAAATTTNDRKRGYNEDGANGGPKKRKYAGEPVVPCKYWKLGKCHYGDKCTFLHD